MSLGTSYAAILPHFRQPTWNYQRGAMATIDRDFLGWQGRFFLYDAIGPYYLRTSKPVFKTLWDNYNLCQYVDDAGDVVYYRDKEGKTIHEYEIDAASSKPVYT